MKKRLICLALTLVMVLALFAGCGEKTDAEAESDREEEASESAMTLSMYLLADELPEDDDKRAAQIDRIEKAVNKITESKFKTRLDLRVFDDETEYYAALDDAYRKRAEAAANGTLSVPEDGDETKEDEMYTDELGVTRIKFPDIASYQVDIMYLGGYDVFSKYLTEEKLQLLDSDLDSASKTLKEYISPSLLKYMKSLNNGTYAIPSNTAIGEYTYLVFDKEVLSAFNYDTAAGIKEIGTDIASESFEKYLNEVKTYVPTMITDKTYVPFASDLSVTELARLCIADCTHIVGESANVTSDKLHYFGVDGTQYTPDKFSLYSSSHNKDGTNGNANSWMDNAGTDTTLIKERVDEIMAYRRSGLLAEESDTVKAAVKCVKGSKYDMDSYDKEKYDVVVIEKPQIVSQDLYEDMFAVSAYTSNTSRSMKIINYLYTNEDFRNILMYGIENEDYELVESDSLLDESGNPLKVVKDLNADYGFDAEKLGNTLIGHYMGGLDTPVYRKSVMEQNNSVVASILMGFNYGAGLNPDALAKLEDNSEKAEELINGCAVDTYSDEWWETNIKPLADELAELNAYPASEEKEGEFYGINYFYTQWATEKGIYKPVE